MNAVARQLSPTSAVAARRRGRRTRIGDPLLFPIQRVKNTSRRPSENSRAGREDRLSQ